MKSARQNGQATGQDKWNQAAPAPPPRQGWLYLAIVLDVFSRSSLGWQVASSLESCPILEAMRKTFDSGLVAAEAFAESSFASFKTEVLAESGFFDSFDHARTAIFDHPETFDNRRRLHGAPGYLSPLNSLNR